MRRTLKTHRVLVAALAVGTLLRAAMLVALPLPLMTFTDANVYVSAAQEFLFRPVEGRTAGYPLILRVLYGVWESPTLPIVIQHVAVLAAAVGLYAVARAGDVPRTFAALAAGVWLVSVDWIWLEHQLLTETMGTVLVAAALAVFALAPARGRATWSIAIAAGLVAGVLSLGAAIVRPALFFALPGIGLAALLLLRAALPVRIVSAGVLVVTCGALLAGYLKVQDDYTDFGMRIIGSELDLGRYPAVAPVAECDRFTPPAGTQALCERTPPDRRPTRDWYYWDPSSPGRELLAARPELEAAIKLWAERAYATHAGDVRRDQLTALRRLFGLGGDARPEGEQGPEILSLDTADTAPAPVVVEAVEEYYGEEDAPNKPAGFPIGVLEALQTPTRPPGLLLLVAFALAVVGAAVGRGRARRLAQVCAVTGWLPVLFGTWVGGVFNWRYVLPGIPFIAVAAFAAAAALLARREQTAHGADGAPSRPAPERREWSRRRETRAAR